MSIGPGSSDSANSHRNPIALEGNGPLRPLRRFFYYVALTIGRL